MVFSIFDEKTFFSFFLKKKTKKPQPCLEYRKKKQYLIWIPSQRTYKPNFVKIGHHLYTGKKVVETWSRETGEVPTP